MSEQTLLASAVFSAVAGSVYAYVGWTLSKRRVSDDAALASRGFAVWWFALAALTYVGGVQALVGTVTDPPLGAVLLATYATLLLLCVALWGLLYYLVYLFTGRRRSWVPLAVFYAAVGAFLFWFIVASQPDRVDVRAWSVTLHYASQVTGTAQSALVAAILLPQFLGAAAYGTLYFKVRDRTLRYRIALVSLAIVVWFGSAYAANLGGLSSSDSWQITSRFIGLAAALTVLMAYQPPPVLRRRFGLRAVSEDAAAATLAEPSRPAGERRPAAPASGLAA